MTDNVTPDPTRPARPAEIVERELLTAITVADFAATNRLCAEVVTRRDAGMPRMSPKRLLTTWVVSRALENAGADPLLAAIADGLEAERRLLSTYGFGGERRWERSTEQAIGWIQRLVSHLRAEVSVPGSHHTQLVREFAFACQLPFLVRFLSRLEILDPISARFERTRAAGIFNRYGLHEFAISLLDQAAWGPVEETILAAAFRRTGQPALALPHVLTALALRVDGYSGCAAAAVCRDVRHPAFYNPTGAFIRDNDIWIHVGLALHRAPTSTSHLRRARDAVTSLFRSFGLDFVTESQRVATQEQALVWPAVAPAGIDEMVEKLVNPKLLNQMDGATPPNPT